MRAPDLERTSGGLTVRLYLTPLRAPRSATVEVSHYGAPLDSLTLAPADGLDAYRHPAIYSERVRGFLTGAPTPDDTPTDLVARVAAYGQTTPLQREETAVWYQVDTIYAGALDGSEAFTGEDAETAAYAYAEAEAADCAREAGKPRPEPDGVDLEDSWAVYVLPHYCDFESYGECTCREYDTDHYPTFEAAAFDAD